MSTAARVAAFAVGLLAVFGLALGAGTAVGPVDEPAEPAHADGGHGKAVEGHGDDDAAAAPASLPGGLQVSQGGYTLVPLTTTARAGEDVPFSFRVDGPDGQPVTRFDVEHDKRLHLIVVRRDHTGFQHVHPTMAADGTWTTDLDLTPGTWRVFADFVPTGGEALTLGVDLAVPGDHRPAATAHDERTTTVDGYTVTIEGDLEAGASARLTARVTRDGRPVNDLQPYLGAFGHLVALREGDLAYLHVHPDGEPGDGRTPAGPEVVFHAEVPSRGGYRLYLDFRHDGVVRTAEFRLGTDDHGH